MKYQLRKVPIAHIRLDGGTQPRAEICQDAVDDYAQAMLDGHEFPAVVLYFDGETYWLADGFHRVLAAEKVKKKAVLADVRDGTRRDAILFSVSANASHGQRRTNEDKRRAVETLLKDPEWKRWSNAEIARRCVVDDKTVAKVRGELKGLSSDFRRCASRNGTTYTVNTANIGPTADVPIAPDLILAFNSLSPEKQAEVLENAREQAKRRSERMEAEESAETWADVMEGLRSGCAKVHRYLVKLQALSEVQARGPFRRLTALRESLPAEARG